MTYATSLASISRIPQVIVELYMTACAESYTIGACTAADGGDGLRCCYSFPTCQDVANFNATTRVFRFCLRDKPTAVEGAGLLPYLKQAVDIPQELDPGRAITKKQRVVLEFFDEPLDRNFHWDKLGGGSTALTNTSTAGTFWRRFRQVYRNYAERRVVVKDGFVGDAIGEYQTRFDGLMADLEITDSGICRVQAVNKLKRAKRKIPDDISDTNVLTADLPEVDTTLHVEDASEFPDPALLSADFLAFCGTGDPDPRLVIELDYDQDKDVSGLVTFTEGSRSVTGIGTSTSFLTELAAVGDGVDRTHDMIWCAEDDRIYASQISAISSNAGLTLVGPYLGKGGTYRAKAGMFEYCQLTARDVVANTLTVTRDYGPTWIGRNHLAGCKIREVFPLRWIGNAPSSTPIDTLDALIFVLQRAGIPDTDIDKAGIRAQRDLWHSGLSSTKCFAWVIDPEEVDKSIQQLSEIGMFSVFVTEAGVITAKVYAPPLPSDTLTTYDETSGFIAGSVSAADNDEDNRLTRVTVAFDVMGDKEGDKAGQYHRAIVRINADSESANGYGDRKGKSILSKFLYRTETYAAIAAVGRTLARFLNGAKRIPFSLELKDAGLDIGDFCILDTSRIQDVIGANSPRTVQVTKKKRGAPGRWDFEGREAFNEHRTGFIGPNTLPADYDLATAAQKKYAFVGSATNKVGDLSEDGYYIF